VLEFERKRLHDGGRRDLVRRIEWTAQIRGDGAGYDLQSFNADGSTRLIEVKTTGLGKYFPFNVTVNEVRCSEARPGEFQKGASQSTTIGVLIKPPTILGRVQN